MSENSLENRKVRVICGTKNGKNPNREFPYIIPITKTKSGYLTGQNLPTEKMLNPALLNETERKSIPYVIDPTDHLRVNHSEWLRLDNPVDKARYELLLLSKKWAKSKKEYNDNKSIYDGYLEDRTIESKTNNDLRDQQFEVESLLRKSTVEDQKRIALKLNSMIPIFNANVNNLTIDELKNILLDACRDFPDKVKECFSQYNSKVEFEFFILELVQHGILKKNPDGSYFDGKDYIGSNMTNIELWVDKNENSYRKNKWAGLLQERKGNIGAVVVDPKEKEEAMVTACQKALYEKNIIEAEEAINILQKYFDNNPKLSEFRNNLELLKSPKVTESGIEELTKFSEDLAKKTIEQLRTTIKHHNSPYKEEDCVDIWGNKDSLIKYMCKIKFQK